MPVWQRVASLFVSTENTYTVAHSGTFMICQILMPLTAHRDEPTWRISTNGWSVSNEATALEKGISFENGWAPHVFKMGGISNIWRTRIPLNEIYFPLYLWKKRKEKSPMMTPALRICSAYGRYDISLYWNCDYYMRTYDIACHAMTFAYHFAHIVPKSMTSPIYQRQNHDLTASHMPFKFLPLLVNLLFLSFSAPYVFTKKICMIVPPEECTKTGTHCTASFRWGRLLDKSRDSQRTSATIWNLLQALARLISLQGGRQFSVLSRSLISAWRQRFDGLLLPT